jgi:hypothetical protein
MTFYFQVSEFEWQLKRTPENGVVSKRNMFSAIVFFDRLRPCGSIVTADLNTLHLTFGERDILDEVIRSAIVHPEPPVFFGCGRGAALLLEGKPLISDFGDDIAAVHV